VFEYFAVVENLVRDLLDFMSKMFLQYVVPEGYNYLYKIKAFFDSFNYYTIFRCAGYCIRWLNRKVGSDAKSFVPNRWISLSKAKVSIVIFSSCHCFPSTFLNLGILT